MSMPTGAIAELGAVVGAIVVPLLYVNMLCEVYVPPAVVTAIGTTPGSCGGTVAVKWLASTTDRLIRSAPPMVPVIAPGVVGKLAPVTVIVLPPWAGPVAGETDVTVGTCPTVYVPYAWPTSVVPPPDVTWSV